jgi:hypothetical protein
MLYENDSRANESDAPPSRPWKRVLLPREVLAQEKEIEDMFRALTARAFRAANLPNIERERENIAWIFVVLMFCAYILGMYLLYLRASGDSCALYPFLSFFPHSAECVPNP